MFVDFSQGVIEIPMEKKILVVPYLEIAISNKINRLVYN